MFLQFSVKNFRSFEKEEVLNLSTGKGSELRDSNTFEFSQNQHLVRSAVIYGPNAGGKSNLIRAIFFLQQFVLASSTAYQEKQKIPLQPFRLNAKSQCKEDGTDPKSIVNTAKRKSTLDKERDSSEMNSMNGGINL